MGLLIIIALGVGWYFYRRYRYGVYILDSNGCSHTAIAKRNTFGNVKANFLTLDDGFPTFAKCTLNQDGTCDGKINYGVSFVKWKPINKFKF